MSFSVILFIIIIRLVVTPCSAYPPPPFFCSCPCVQKALVRDIRSRLSEGDLAGVVDKLVALDKSRQPLEDMPGSVQRAETIKELRSELETQLLPCVRAAMGNAGGESSSYVPLSELVAMYERLGQTDMLCHEYAKTRTLPLHELWYVTYTNMLHLYDP